MTINRKYYELKTVLVGDHYTGKTTLVQRLLTGKLSPYIDTTIGCAFSTINRMTDDGIPIQFQIWDTAGQERYRALSKLYFRNAEIILLCFTVDSRESFDNLTNWIKILKKECINKNILYFLVANKSDLTWKTEREVIQNFANENNLILCITSSFENIGIIQLLDTIILHSSKICKEPYDKSKNKTISLNKSTMESKCCN